MGAMREACSVCGSAFDVQFRYQMEEGTGGFSYFCTQKCLETSQRAGGDGAVPCDACATRFRVDLVSQVLYVKGQRKYACTMDCRNQLAAEARGLRLGDLAAQAEVTVPRPAAPPVAPPIAPAVPVAAASPSSRPVALAVASAASPTPLPSATQPAGSRPAVAVPMTPRAARAAAPTPIRAVAIAARAAVPTMVAGMDVWPTASAQVSSVASADPSGPAPLPKIIACFNHKGGTGKTTTSVSLAAGLALRGKKVLLVDTDAQGNVSVSLGVKSERSLYHVLVMGLAGKDAVTNVRPNLDIIPSNETLAAAELYLAGRQNRDRVLATRLASIVTQYDYVVVDCSPSLSLLNQNALCLVDSVLVPVACDYLSLVGMRQVIKTVKNVNQLLHHPVRIWGILPTFYDARAKLCHEAVDTLKQHFGPRCLRPIRQAIKVKEAPAQGQTIFEYAPGTPPAEDYAHVVSCVLGEVAESAPAPSSR